MLELLTCEYYIATKGLHFILGPKRWRRRFSTVLHGRFGTDKNFGTKFLYSIDRVLQIFVKRLSRIDDTDGERNEIEDLLLQKAKALMTSVEYGEMLAIKLPTHLAQNAGKATSARTATSPMKETEATTSATSTRRPAKKGTTSASFHHPSEDQVNSHPQHTSWLVSEEGVDSSHSSKI